MYYISIIIPTYNSSSFLDECIESILSQKTKYDYELIFVDDGSIDNTIDILNKYQNENSNIYINNQKHSGQSSARNKALDLAKGRYIMFLDSDDILLPNSINNLMDNAIKYDADIVEGYIAKFIDSINNVAFEDIKTHFSIYSYNKYPRFVLTSLGYSVGKVYKRELWETLRFPEGVIFEDIITKFILRRKANKVVHIPEVVYGYRQHNKSSSHSGSDKLLDSFKVYPMIVDLCKKENVPFDNIFYLLSLNHIGLLNYIVLKNKDYETKKYYFNIMRNQLLDIEQYKTGYIPLMFLLLRKSIIDDDMDKWLRIAEIIHKYRLLAKWREIN